MHAALAVHATLAAFGTIFEAYPTLCPCEPRRPLGDMQAVSCGARSRQYSRLLPASSSQPRSIVERAGSGLVLYIELKINSIRYGRKNVRYSIRYRYDIDIRYFATIRSDNDNEAEKATWTADSILLQILLCVLHSRDVVRAIYR